MGRHVNMASRIEALTVGGQILVAESALAELGSDVRVDGHIEFTAKGAREAMRVYDIGGLGGAGGFSLPRDLEESAERAEERRCRSRRPRADRSASRSSAWTFDGGDVKAPQPADDWIVYGLLSVIPRSGACRSAPSS